MIAIEYYLVLGAALFAVGVYGVLVRRNAVLILMSIELMLQAVNINLLAFSTYLIPEEIPNATSASSSQSSSSPSPPPRLGWP